MGNQSSDLTPPHARGQPPPTGTAGAETYAGVRVEAMPGVGGRVVAGAGRGGHRHGGSWGDGPSARPPPQTVVQKTKLVRNSCHVHKESVRLTRMEPLDGARYQLQFRFDAEAACTITVYFLADESKDPETGRLVHRPRFPGEDGWVVGPHKFGPGASQAYSTASVGYEGADLAARVPPYSSSAAGAGGSSFIYIVIRPDVPASASAAAGDTKVEAQVSSQITVLRLEPKGRASLGASSQAGSSSSSSNSSSSSSWGDLAARVVKQKLETPQGVFVMQEIYGIAAGQQQQQEQGGAAAGGGGDEDVSAADCVICLTNKRELAILPCRHMCVCRFCAAEVVQSHGSKCPICRQPAQALLKLTRDDDDEGEEAGVKGGQGARAL